MKNYLGSCFVIFVLCVPVFLALITGCTKDTVYIDKNTGEQIQVDEELINIQKYLPPRATDVEKLGNNWFTFQLQTGEVNRKFLLRKNFGSHGERGVVVTELNLTKPCTCGTMCETKGTKNGEGAGLVE